MADRHGRHLRDVVEDDAQAVVGNAVEDARIGCEYAVVRNILVIEGGSMTTCVTPSERACRVKSTVSAMAQRPVPGISCEG